jgi:NTP pyrophosphatase (non-canonical NTP hydrolase)
MSDLELEERQVEAEIVDSVQRRCYSVSEEHGFHRTDGFRAAVYSIINEHDLDDAQFMLVEQIINGLASTWAELQHTKRLLLIVGELVEAFEEMRAGHAVTEVYEKNGKPEGVPVELADVQIRLWDLAETMGISLQGEVLRKEAFNRTREFMHGKKF